MNEKELMRLAVERAEWAGILIREIEEVLHVHTEVAHNVVNRLRDTIEAELVPVAGYPAERMAWYYNGAENMLRILGVQNMTLANYGAAVRAEIDAVSYKG